MKRFRLLAAVLSLSALVFGPARAPAQLAPIRIGHNSFPDESVLYLARDVGIFKKHGIALELVYIPGGSLSMQALIGKSLDLLLSGGTPFVYAYLKGAPVKIIGGLNNRLPYHFIGREDIRSAEQLKGKKVGISRFGSNTDFVARLALARLGLNPARDVTIVQAGGQDARMVALKSGAIDATLLTPELSLVGQRLGHHVLLDFIDEGIEYQHIAFISRQDYLKSQGEKVRRMMGAYVEGIQYYLAHRDEAVKETVKLLKLTDREVAEVGYNYRLKTLPRDGRPTAKGMQLVLDAAAQDDPKAKGLTVQQLVDLSFLP